VASSSASFAIEIFSSAFLMVCLLWQGVINRKRRAEHEVAEKSAAVGSGVGQPGELPSWAFIRQESSPVSGSRMMQRCSDGTCSK
jgi:hypothetical protein